ncbi:hypothetical protein RRG08_006780 [Elysia crispata]|uniref:Integrase zinc-binding domain-containing protein n=1 Tax=Elysia crispata TaxID=231223 RepID=A0AAE1CW11_9GAST|nr:hypothetical protein RRG08_006780 [Elysia crispata]
MQNTIRFVKPCITCQKHCSKLPRLPVQQADIVDRPFDKVAIDIVGPLTVTDNKCRYILVDTATRWPEAVPLREIRTHSHRQQVPIYIGRYCNQMARSSAAERNTHCRRRICTFQYLFQIRITYTNSFRQRSITCFKSYVGSNRNDENRKKIVHTVPRTVKRNGGKIQRHS